MIELRRMILVDWYLFRAEQIDLAGMTALIGPNGAGKSAVIDAAQTVLTGANMHSIRFNASAQSTSRSKRSIRDYCLGVVSLDEKGERSEPTREEGYTYIVLGFVDIESGQAINLGVTFSASASRSEERCEARFMVRDTLVDLRDLLEPLDGGEVETRQWHAVRQLLRARGLRVEDDFGSASDFVAESLRALSPAGFPLDPRRFIKAFRNALLLKPVDNPTDFVRNYVLDIPTIRVDRLRRSIELYRELTGKIENLKAQTASLAQVHRIVGRIFDNERAINVTEWQIARLKWERFRREVRQLQAELKHLRAETETRHQEAVRATARQSRIDLDLSHVELTLKTSDGEMTSAFRDDLLHRLHDAFEGIKETLAELNRHLKDREFHGRDYYVFRSSPDPAHADMLQLVQESRRPDFHLPFFAERNRDEPDTPIVRAVRLIEAILADPAAKTDEIEDPRKYFNFEVFIQDKSGKIRSSLSSRAGTGSGGEGQLPFYIAIGASLAATYRNRRTGETGLALAIFDEAFNRLDTKAICACSDFMRELGLQIVVATPDEKRHVFMEVADTIVNVNRSGNLVMVDTEHLSAKTRETLTEADPYRKGFDAFKADLIARADAAPELRAAE